MDRLRKNQAQESSDGCIIEAYLCVIVRNVTCHNLCSKISVKISGYDKRIRMKSDFYRVNNYKLHIRFVTVIHCFTPGLGRLVLNSACFVINDANSHWWKELPLG